MSELMTKHIGKFFGRQALDNSGIDLDDGSPADV